MTREEAIKTLKENCCAMCAYCSKDMDSCDIRSCDNKDAIKVLEQESCEDAIKYFNNIYELSRTLGVPYSFIADEIKEIEKALKALPQESCNDAISRQATIDEVSRIMLDRPLDGYEDGQLILKTIQGMPPVTPAEKIGKWVTVNKSFKVTIYKCSECGRIVRDDTGYDVIKDYPYCHCGAKMGGDAE